ncbi:ead/Ea22-like family protein, partial [Salmonella enterica]|nr:ead/Ea22-like family protein [Salmonella enterica]ELP0964261.1 ead/Ea22-like family protein [Salmonella enterica]
MSKIDHQALREAAERATPAMERLLMLPVDDDLLSEQELKDYGVDIDALNAFKFLTGPETVLALLDENLQLQREKDAIEAVALALRDDMRQAREQLEAARKRIAEQREYYEGVIADGSKRIAELERSETQLINERDDAESALNDAYKAVMGQAPEWSNWFSFGNAIDEIELACELWRNQTDDVIQFRQRIAELEARAVNLPKRSVGEVMHLSGFS